MALRSMTGFAQVKGQIDEQTAFTLSLKSVNHRFLDLHLRLPAEMDALEMAVRRLLKEKLARGHVQVTLQLDRGGAAAGYAVNREVVGGFVEAFRAAAKEFDIATEPDLNAILKMPGALNAAAALSPDALEAPVLAALGEAVERLNEMRVEEGRSIDRELRARMQALRAANAGVEQRRALVSRAYLEKVQSRMQELVGAHADAERILQEAALLAERSDVQEETVRMYAHIEQFLSLLSSNGEVGKKLDFLLQEMNREANTLLSKTSGVAGEGLGITELGIAMKSEIEKSREQVQNVE